MPASAVRSATAPRTRTADAPAATPSTTTAPCAIVEPAVNPAHYFPFVATAPRYDSPAKRENLARVLAVREAASLTVEAAPPYIRFEPCAVCNLRCCWAQREPTHPRLRPRGLATPALAERIVEQIGAALYQVILCHWGEPTMNPRLPEIVRVFHDAGIYTTFDTNMTRVTPALAEGLVRAGLDRISASIDGTTQETYGRYRVGGRVDEALAGLRNIAAARAKHGGERPYVRWQYLVFPHNEAEVDEAARFAAAIGVDEFEPFGGGGRPWTRESGFGPATTPERPAGLLCNDPWMYLAVDWDGAVHLCCRAFQARHVAGHMDDAPLRVIFDNDRFRLARRVIRDGAWSEADGPTPCTGCNKVTRFVPDIRSLGHGLGLNDK